MGIVPNEITGTMRSGGLILVLLSDPLFKAQTELRLSDVAENDVNSESR